MTGCPRPIDGVPLRLKPQEWRLPPSHTLAPPPPRLRRLDPDEQAAARHAQRTLRALLDAYEEARGT